MGHVRTGRSDAIRVRLAWGLACVLWSATFLFIRIGVADIGPFTFAAGRLAGALVVLIPLALYRQELAGVARRDVVAVAAAGSLLLGVNYALVYWGAQHLSSGLVAIVLAATPIVALALGTALRIEVANAVKIGAVVLGFAGVVLVFRSEATLEGSRASAGLAAVLSSTVCVAGAYVWMKRHAARVSPLAMAAIQNAAGLVPLAALALGFEGSPLQAAWTPRSLAALAYLAWAASIIAFYLNYWLLARMDPSAMLMMGVAEVPLAIGLGALVLHERMPSGTLFGAACIATSVLLGPMRKTASAAGRPGASATTHE